VVLDLRLEVVLKILVIIQTVVKQEVEYPVLNGVK
jgi:hypothetical protein